MQRQQKLLATLRVLFPVSACMTWGLVSNAECSTSFQTSPFKSCHESTQCLTENQASPWQLAMCPYQACEGMLVEAEKLSSMASMEGQPGSYVSLLNMGISQENWASGLEAAQDGPPSKSEKGEIPQFAAAFWDVISWIKYLFGRAASQIFGTRSSLVEGMSQFLSIAWAHNQRALPPDLDRLVLSNIMEGPLWWISAALTTHIFDDSSG